MTTPTDIFNWIKAQNPSTQSLNAIEFGQFRTELIARLGTVSVNVPGASANATTLLYSGELGYDRALGTDRVQMWQAAEAIGVQSHGQVRTIGQTELGRLMNDPAFRPALYKALGNNLSLLDELLSGKTVNNIRIEPSLWDIGSKWFVQAGNGDYKVLAPFAQPGSVLSQTEIAAALSMPSDRRKLQQNYRVRSPISQNDVN
jgi:hypothetical protein